MGFKGAREGGHGNGNVGVEGSMGEGVEQEGGGEVMSKKFYDVVVTTLVKNASRKKGGGGIDINLTACFLNIDIVLSFQTVTCFVTLLLTEVLNRRTSEWQISSLQGSSRGSRRNSTNPPSSLLLYVGSNT